MAKSDHYIRQAMLTMYEEDWKKQAMKVMCPLCDAKPGDPCVKTINHGRKAPNRPMGTPVPYRPHKNRIEHGKNVFLLGGDDDE